jgi:hypothetical protein
MTRPAYFALGAMALALPVVFASSPQPKYVFSSQCFSVQQTERSVLEVPLKDKQPDMDSAIIRHVKINYRPDCGQLEMR